MDTAWATINVKDRFMRSWWWQESERQHHNRFSIINNRFSTYDYHNNRFSIINNNLLIYTYSSKRRTKCSPPDGQEQRNRGDVTLLLIRDTDTSTNHRENVADPTHSASYWPNRQRTLHRYSLNHPSIWPGCPVLHRLIALPTLPVTSPHFGRYGTPSSISSSGL